MKKRKEKSFLYFDDKLRSEQVLFMAINKTILNVSNKPKC